MGARTSPQMLHAMTLIRSGKSAYEAAKIAGVTRGAISKSKLYRDWKESHVAKTA